MGIVSFSGLASGIDGDAVIEAVTNARKNANRPLENDVEFNKIENTALEEINTKLLSLNDSLSGFLSLTGGSVTKKVTSSNTDFITATASSSAVNSNTSMTVDQLARNATLSFDDRFSSVNDPIAPGMSGSGTLDITVGQGDSAEVLSITIDNETTLSSLVEDINEATNGSVQASFLNAGSNSNPEYLFVLQGLKTGEEAGSMTVSASPELTGAGVFNSSTLEQAQDSIVTLLGVGQITRPSNQISNILPGLSVDLKQVSAAPITLTVSNDTEKTAEKLGQMVESLNDIIRYSDENDTIERVENEENATNVYGALAKTRVDDQAIESLRGALSGTKATIEGSTVSVFADIGVTIERDGTYKFDQEKFESAMGESPIAVEQLLSGFADRVATTDGVVSQYTGFGGVIDTAIDSNDSANKAIQERMDRINRSIEAQTTLLRRSFTNLERTVGELNSQSSALSGILAGLG